MKTSQFLCSSAAGPGSLLLALFLAIGTPSLSQAPGAAIHTGVKFEKDGYPNYLGSSCEDGTIYVIRGNARNEHALYAFLPSGEVRRKEIKIEAQREHEPINGFISLHGKPCVLYDQWDKGTGVISLFAQPYTAELETDGSRVAIGTIPLNRWSYDGSQIQLTYKRSPDESKWLLLYDKIQQGGMKLAMCWIMDEDLRSVWSGVYQVPVRAQGASSRAWLMDNGHLYMSVQAVALGEDDVKEARDGSMKVKHEGLFYGELVTTWFEMFGETFNHWANSDKELVLSGKSVCVRG